MFKIVVALLTIPMAFVTPCVVSITLSPLCLETVNTVQAPKTNGGRGTWEYASTQHQHKDTCALAHTHTPARAPAPTHLRAHMHTHAQRMDIKTIEARLEAYL